ncbi:MAG: hypothetical protein JRC68_08740 [Deltaproteobacteria bacterium]|nr:hypothetical protein [Deltaproteobacteria bacterium]
MRITPRSFSLVFIFLFTFLSYGYGEVRGTIYYTDDTVLDFYDIEYIFQHLESSGHYGKSKYLVVNYQNSFRTIPFSKLRSLEVIKFEIEGSKPAITRYLHNVTLVVETITGVTFETGRYKTIGECQVKILDELTDEITLQKIWFGKDQRLNIWKIVFDN